MIPEPSRRGRLTRAALPVIIVLSMSFQTGCGVLQAVMRMVANGPVNPNAATGGGQLLAQGANAAQALRPPTNGTNPAGLIPGMNGGAIPGLNGGAFQNAAALPTNGNAGPLGLPRPALGAPAPVQPRPVFRDGNPAPANTNPPSSVRPGSTTTNLYAGGPTNGPLGGPVTADFDRMA